MEPLPLDPVRVCWLRPGVWARRGRPPLLPRLSDCLAIGVRAAIDPLRCAAWSAAVLGAKERWSADFGGEQFSLGRAFYTHLETGRSGEYFAGAAASDAAVEAVAPGLQHELQALFVRLSGGAARPRRGFCGPGVHVFPPGEKVARVGGVVHFDTEGLTPLQLQGRARALSLVVMLQPAVSGGALRVWDVRYAGRDHATRAERRARHFSVASQAGDALLMDSYRLHQICGFGGDRARLTAVLHGVEVDAGQWETWF